LDHIAKATVQDFEGVHLNQSARVLHCADKVSESAMPNLKPVTEIPPNATRNFVGTSNPPTHAALIYAKIAGERRLPFLAVNECADALEKFFAHEGLLPRFSGGANPHPKRFLI
jgi:hypothetical protein